MRYEHIELDISTAGCAALLQRLEHPSLHHCDEVFGEVDRELTNFVNELRARLQRRDPDPKCPKNKPTEDWLDT